MKRSLSAEQILTLNSFDFERSGIKRKSGYRFSFSMKHGKVKNVIVDLPLASGLASVLLEDKVVRELIETNEFHIAFNHKYELTVRHIPQSEAILVG
jgi:hypothetical protein